MHRFVIVVVLVAAVSPWFATGASTTTADDRIAVVDLGRILAEAKPFRAEEESIRTWIETEKKSLDAQSKEIESLSRELERITPANPEWTPRSRTLDEKKMHFRHAVEDRERERMKRIVAAQKRWFVVARKAVADVAKERGLSVVLQLRQEEPDGERPDELNSEIFLTDVLYSDPSLDITLPVLMMLNR